MRTESFTFLAADGISLPGLLWLPDTTPALVLQITHGMTEHIGRFAPLAELLTQAGFAVAGFDLRGHGRNPGDPVCASMGETGWEASLSDLAQLSGWLRQRLPGVPHAMLGFSLGSFLLREYLSRCPETLCGAILMGTGTQPGAVLSLLKALIRTQISRHGFDQTTPLVKALSFDAYNRSIRPHRTEADWLCADPAQLDAYLADPLCRRSISAGLFWQLLDSMQRTGAAHACDSWPKNLPVLLLSGSEDPVGSCGKGVTAVARQLQQAGLYRVQTQLIPHARHDVLHEEASGGAEAARRYILTFLQDVVR